jgi:DNA-binding NarL/FixJ family response regulator
MLRASVQEIERCAARPTHCDGRREHGILALPRRRDAARHIYVAGQEDRNDMMGPTVRTSAPSWRDTGALRRLVIVADNSVIVQAIRIAFRQSGEFKLVGWADARKTTAGPILGTHPDVIILDDMDHSQRMLELLREIRAQDDDVALLVLSLDLDSHWLSRVFSAGATAAISKATQPLALATLVRETIDGHIVHPAPAGTPSAAEPGRSVAADLPLTTRELEILELVASGATNGVIARRLCVTEQTVKFHLRNIYRKLDVANRTEASHFAHVKGLVGVASPPSTSRRPLLTVAS